MFPSARRTIAILFKAPLVPPPAGPPAIEMTMRPRAASRTFSNMSVRSTYGSRQQATGRRYASDHGKKELYSDEAGSVGAGIDDVAHTDAAFDKNANPASASKDIEKETGKDFTKHAPSDSSYSQPPGEQGKPRENDAPLRTSKSEAKNH